MTVTALLVDDEWPILDNLRSIIPWEDLGITLAGLARSGAEGLEMVERDVPDLVLCDIRMPVMDGLTFVGELRKRGIESDVIMLTGYQEFEYAREAIQKGVREYITKPIDYFSLEDTLRTLTAEITTRKWERAEAESQKEKMQGWIRHRYLLDVLRGEEALLTDTQSAGREEAGGYALLIAEARGYYDHTRGWTGERRRAWNDIIYLRLKRLAEQCFSTKDVVRIREGEWCVLISGSLTAPGIWSGHKQLEDEAAAFSAACMTDGMEGCLLMDRGPYRLSELAAAYRSGREALMSSGTRVKPLIWAEHGPVRKSAGENIDTVKSYIQAHLSRDLGVEELAEYTGISSSYFCQLFKARFGVTFVEYVTRERLAAARTLLSGSYHSISAIGTAVGYRERRYFTKVFHKHFGMTPSEYRELNKITGNDKMIMPNDGSKQEA